MPSKKKNTDYSSGAVKGFKIGGLVIGKIITYILNIIMTVLLIALITGTICGVVFLVYVNNYLTVDMSNFSSLATEQNMTTRLYYMDYQDREARIGTPVEMEDQQLFSNENRTWISYDDMPTYLVEAFRAIEDERFWDHSGVDWKRTLGATYGFVSGTDTYGGSTITQQLIKNITGEDDVTIQRKVREIISALDLEKHCSKEQIMEMYLNTIYLSEHSYGVQAAATAYFGKDVKDLTLPECAALAAIPKYPTKYDPYLNPENNEDRRGTVLYKMHELGIINDQEYEESLNTEIHINEEIERATQSATTSWYTDAVIEDAIDLLMDHYGWTEQIATQKVYTGGFNIYTVMDPRIQNILEEYFKDDDNFARIRSGVQPEASMIICDPYTDDILGIAGGRGEKTSSRVLNFATQTTRSPGSSIKPVCVYGPALESGLITYSSVYEDSPVTKRWPANYPAGYRGPTTIHDAVARSVNTIAVKVLNDLGYENSYEFAHNKLGMHSIIDNYVTKSGTVITDLNPSALALGGMNYGLTLRELTCAYQVFANKGIFDGGRTIVKILDYEGNVVVDNGCKGEIVMSEQNASIMTRILQNVVSVGTASKLTLDNRVNVAGKTGTTSDDNDRWFIGYTPYYLGGAWFGYEMPMALTGFSETSSPALVVWDNVMKLVHQQIFDEVKEGERDLEKFSLADGVITMTICKRSGLLMTKSCSGFGETGYFASGSQPKKYCNASHASRGDDSGSGNATSATSVTGSGSSAMPITDSNQSSQSQSQSQSSATTTEPPQTTTEPPQTTTAAPQTTPAQTDPEPIPIGE